MSRSSPLVIDLNLSTSRRCTSQERKVPLHTGLSKGGVKTVPVSPHFHCKADQLVASLQASLCQATDQISSLSLRNSLLERELAHLKSLLDDKSFPKRESTSTATASLTPDSALTKLVADCKAQEETAQTMMKDLRRRLDSKSRKIRGLEDELRAGRRELEAAMRSNRCLRIELTATKDALASQALSDSVTSATELVIARQKVAQIESDLTQMVQKQANREQQLREEIDQMKEKNRKLQDELIQNESALFICKIELSAKH